MELGFCIHQLEQLLSPLLVQSVAQFAAHGFDLLLLFCIGVIQEKFLLQGLYVVV